MGIKIRGLEALRTLCGNNADNEIPGSEKSNGFSITQSGDRNDSSPILDKYTVQEKVMPLLKAIKTKEPTVMVSTIVLFDA